MTVVAPIRPKRRILPGTREQVRQARLFVRQALGDCPGVEDAVLLVSELATNAIAHTASGQDGKFLVTVYLDESRVRVEVLDGGSDKVPVVRSWEDGRESGNGLAVVDRIATRWGHRGGSRQRVVWFELEWSIGERRIGSGLEASELEDQHEPDGDRVEAGKLPRYEPTALER